QGSFAEAFFGPQDFTCAEFHAREDPFVETVQLVLEQHTAGEVVTHLGVLVDTLGLELAVLFSHDFHQSAAAAVAGGNKEIIPSADRCGNVAPVVRLPGKAPMELAILGRNTHQSALGEENNLPHASRCNGDGGAIAGLIVLTLPNYLSTA